MICRDIELMDLPRIQELFKQQGFEYDLPALSDFVEGILIETPNGTGMVCAARPTVELYLLVDKNWQTPFIRNEALKMLHEEMEKRLSQRRYGDAHIWVPPTFEKSFGRRLVKKFGWVKSGWTCFVHFVERGL